jgi:hypothetical protein
VQVDELTSGNGAVVSGIDFSTNETWNRLNADPLLLIRRNEVTKVKAVTSNPYLVAQLKKQLRAERSAKANKKHKKKDKANKEKKHKRRRSSRCVVLGVALALTTDCSKSRDSSETAMTVGLTSV